MQPCQEAKDCADAIVRATVVFQYDPAAQAMVAQAASAGASSGWNTDNFSQMNTWFNALMADSFA